MDVPTFAELYGRWKKYKKSLKDKLSDSTWKNYEIAFNHLAPLHSMKIINIKVNDMQECLNSHNHQSKSTIGNIRASLKGIYAYAVMNEYIEQDITQYLVFEYTKTSTSIHIDLLWNKLYVVNNVDIILINIYTGMRPTELLEVLTENVHLDERYTVGVLKTEHGYSELFPFKYPITSDTLYFGGILTNISMCSGHASASIISIPFLLHNSLRIRPTSALIWL